jgi:hypothetical protein
MMNDVSPKPVEEDSGVSIASDNGVVVKRDMRREEKVSRSW